MLIFTFEEKLELGQERTRAVWTIDQKMAGLAPAFLHLYSTKDFFTISLVQVLAAWTSVAVSNFASTSVSLLTRSAASLRLFCFVFAMLCFALIRTKSRIRLSVSFSPFVVQDLTW